MQTQTLKSMHQDKCTYNTSLVFSLVIISTSLVIILHCMIAGKEKYFYLNYHISQYKHRESTNLKKLQVTCLYYNNKHECFIS